MSGWVHFRWTASLYERTAACMRKAMPASYEHGSAYLTQQWRADCNALADMFKENAPSFDRERFLKDCGVK